MGKLSSDPYFRDRELVRLECANFQGGHCLFESGCKIDRKEVCGYFEKAVKPLLHLKYHL